MAKPSKLDAFAHLLDQLSDAKLAELADVKPAAVAAYRKRVEADKADAAAPPPTAPVEAADPVAWSGTYGDAAGEISAPAPPEQAPAVAPPPPEPPAPVVASDPRLVKALFAAKRGVAAAIAALRAARGLPPGEEIPPELHDVFEASVDAAEDLYAQRDAAPKPAPAPQAPGPLVIELLRTIVTERRNSKGKRVKTQFVRSIYEGDMAHKVMAAVPKDAVRIISGS